jgi:uncharacterized membrane protein
MKFLKPPEGRLWQVDAARGIAVLMMIAFHFLFDLWYFAGLRIVLDSGFWLLFARTTLIIFLLLVGVSLSLSHGRVKGKLSQSEMAKKYLKRGLRIFGWGLIITAITFAAFPSSAIWFGVLHLIGLSIIFAIPVLSHRKTALAVGIMLILVGFFLSQITFSFPWLLWFGLMPQGFYTFDYVPVLPWSGVVLVGLFLGSLVAGMNATKLPKNASPFCFLGRNSLLIYLIHQPVLVGLILLIL